MKLVSSEFMILTRKCFFLLARHEHLVVAIITFVKSTEDKRISTKQVLSAVTVTVNAVHVQLQNMAECQIVGRSREWPAHSCPTCEVPSDV